MTIVRHVQDIFKADGLPKHVTFVTLDDEDMDWEVAFSSLFDSNDAAPASEPTRDSDDEDFTDATIIGLAALISAADNTVTVSHLAFSNADRVIVFPAPEGGFEKSEWTNREKLIEILAGTLPTSDPYVLVGFEMASLALALKDATPDFGIKAIDLSVLDEAASELPSVIIQKVMSEEIRNRQFEHHWRKLPPLPEGKEPDGTRRQEEATCVAWRAWMSLTAASASPEAISDSDPINTSSSTTLSAEQLAQLVLLQRQYTLLEGANMETTTTEFTSIAKAEEGEGLVVQQAAFKNKARMGKAQDVRLWKDGQVVARGRVTETKGKKATITTVDGQEIETDGISTIEVVGRQDLTKAEVARNALFLQLLQGKQELDSSIYIRKIWLPSEEDLAELEAAKQSLDGQGPAPNPEDDPLHDTELNPSQANVARAMLSDHSFALVHGPPGTGKTRTIAEVVKIWISQEKRAYIVAQTNVGVKNVAEALIKQEVTQFKLLVSEEFYSEWHEKEYEKCVDYMVTSGQFREELKKLKDVKVILCTLAMLFSRRLDKMSLFAKIPLERLIVDEASQIFVGEYLALFQKFQASLKKVCWFGDPKQLPPYQREQIEGLQSIYDIPHIKAVSAMLTTQYRMPPTIGEFVSGAMYNNDLQSWNKHPTEGYECVKFVDVPNGAEELDNNSWINDREAETMAELVRLYYHDQSFSIITPYDAQRKLIEKKLKEKMLPGEGRCFNLDSFQGNEDHYILISCVRTSRVGFLDLHNRINVMLTRCQRGMVIVTSSVFLLTQGRMTLVGRLAEAWSQTAPDYEVWAYYMDVHNKQVDMPGVKGDKWVVEDKPKKLEPVANSGFYPAYQPPASKPIGLGSAWGSAPSSSKSSTKKAAGKKAASSSWLQGGPKITAPVAKPAGAWGTGKPNISAPKASPGTGTSASSSFTMSSLSLGPTWKEKPGQK